MPPSVTNTPGIVHVAASKDDFQSSLGCGVCLKITGSGKPAAADLDGTPPVKGTLKAIVVDEDDSLSQGQFKVIISSYACTENRKLAYKPFSFITFSQPTRPPLKPAEQQRQKKRFCYLDRCLRRYTCLQLEKAIRGRQECRYLKIYRFRDEKNAVSYITRVQSTYQSKNLHLFE